MWTRVLELNKQNISVSVPKIYPRGKIFLGGNLNFIKYIVLKMRAKRAKIFFIRDFLFWVGKYPLLNGLINNNNKSSNNKYFTTK